MTPDVVNAGAAWFARPRGVGIVRASFRRAAYVAFGDELLAVCGADVSSGPLHLRVRPLPRLTVGERFDLDVDPRRLWTPAHVDPAGLELHRGIAASVLGGVPSPFDASVTSTVRAALGACDLAEVARLLGGRGPGLTPAGDDVLAGILVADAVGRDRFGTLRKAVVDALAAATNDVSRAFLRWAARGQSIDPVHTLLASVAAGDVDRAQRAMRILRAVGGTSGSDLAFGVRLALSVDQAEASALATSTSGPSARVFDT